MRETHKHQRKPTNQTILLGDLNSSWLDTDRGGTHPALHRWASQTGWEKTSRLLADQDSDARICTNWTSLTPVQAPTMPCLLGSHIARSPATVSD